MLYEHLYTNSKRLAQICAIFAEIQNFFLGDCFLLVHHVEVKYERIVVYDQHVVLSVYWK